MSLTSKGQIGHDTSVEKCLNMVHEEGDGDNDDPVPEMFAGCGLDDSNAE
jgi:hypothetical protein